MRPASAKIDDFNTGDNEGSRLFPGQPEARPAPERLSRLPGAGAGTPRTPRLEIGVMVERVVVEDGRAVAVEFSHGGESPARRRHRRGRAQRRRGRLARDPRTLRHRRRRAAARPRHRHRARSARRRREPAGPSPDPAGLQGRGRAHAQHRLCQALAPAADGAGICRAPHRPADHGALAGRRLRQVLARLRHAPICSSISSRSRSTDGASACTRSAPSPPASAICARRAAAASIFGRPMPGTRRRSPRTISPRTRTGRSRSTR